MSLLQIVSGKYEKPKDTVSLDNNMEFGKFNIVHAFFVSLMDYGLWFPVFIIFHKVWSYKLLFEKS